MQIHKLMATTDHGPQRRWAKDCRVCIKATQNKQVA